MPPEISDNLVLIVAGAIGAYALWRYKSKPAKATQASVPQAAPQTVYVQSPSAPRVKLLDLYMEHDEEAKEELRRLEVKRRLDQAALDRATLNRIAECVPKMTGETDPK